MASKSPKLAGNGLSLQLDEGSKMYGILSSCSVIIHQTINAKNVYVTVDGLTLALIVLVAVVGLAALFFTVRAFSR